jgi:predicted Zn-dependent protease
LGAAGVGERAYLASLENGHIAGALWPYEQALRFDLGARLLRIELSQVCVENNDPPENKRAIADRREALRTEAKDVDACHLLATAYDRDNQIGMAALSLAEEGFAADRKRHAVREATRAEHLLPKSSFAHVRAGNSFGNQRPRGFRLRTGRRPRSLGFPAVIFDQRSWVKCRFVCNP